MKKLLTTSLTLLAVACAVIVSSAVAGNGKGQAGARLYQFRGELVSASSSSVTITVEGGNRAALKAMLGQTQNQTFTVGDTTEVLLWSKGVPAVGKTPDLKPGDWVVVNVRAKSGSTLGDVEANAAGIVSDRGSAPTGKAQPLFLFRGTVDGAQSGGRIALHVKGGNRNALRLLIGQSSDQAFSYDANTVFLLWQGKVPSVIDASQLKAGDRITVRIRAPKRSTLAQVEATPAKHVGDHEPANAPDRS